MLSRVTILSTLLLTATGALAHPRKVHLQRQSSVDASTLLGKAVFGYQGWFRAPNDPGSGNLHWSSNHDTIDASTILIDVWPDVSEFPAECLFDTGFQFANGSNAQLYSNLCQGVVDTHFRWMQENGIDGIFAQRFHGDIADDTFTTILGYIRDAAEKYGRIFAVEYDANGLQDDPSNSVFSQDWTNVIVPQFTNSPAYLHHNGKPVVEIWGLDIVTGVTPDLAHTTAQFFVDQGVHLILGVTPSFLDDSQADYLPTVLLANTIQPWFVGSFCTDGDYDGFHGLITTHIDYLAANHSDIGYAPTLLVGSSNHNLAANSGDPNAQPSNACPRNGGDFFWHQLNQTVKDGVFFNFIAMFDEVNEATSVTKALNKADLPTTGTFVAMDADGTQVPENFYLSLGGQAGSALRAAQQTTPPKSGN